MVVHLNFLLSRLYAAIGAHMLSFAFQVPVLLRAEDLDAALADLSRLERLPRVQHPLQEVHSPDPDEERGGQYPWFLALVNLNWVTVVCDALSLVWV